MEQATTINWEPILWVGGCLLTFFGILYTVLLSYIAVINKESKRLGEIRVIAQNERLEKHEGWILAQQKDLHEMSEKTSIAIELIKHEQAQGQERLKIFREEFFKHGKGKK